MERPKSITKLMKEQLRKNPQLTIEVTMKLIKKYFPKSKFKQSHLSWYKSAMKRGALKGVR